jgi:23S rRNA-/tRNA-specific pseudouridylate synthase
MSTIQRSTLVLPQDGGKELSFYLALRFTYFSQDQWEFEIAQGRVRRNGEPTEGRAILEPKDLITFTPLPYQEPPVRTDWTLLEEDEHFAFINKPPFLPCHPGGIYLHNTLLSMLTPRWPEARLVNRLDRETSGIVVLAKHREAAAGAAREFSEGRVEKRYYVLVEGLFPHTLEARGILVRDEDSPVRKKVRLIPSERPRVHTSFSRGGNPFAMEGIPGMVSPVWATLHTGKTHQIRASLCSLGFPVVGDKLYGPDDSLFLRFTEDRLTVEDRCRLGMDRQALHCAFLSFTAGGSTYHLEAPLGDGWPQEALFSPLQG